MSLLPGPTVPAPANIKATPSSKADILRIAIFSVSYAATYQLGLLLPDLAGVIGSIWPASGVALAGLLLSPRRQWPLLLAVIGIVAIASSIHLGRPVLCMAGFLCANVGEPLLCAWLMQRWCGERISFERVRELLSLIGVTVFANACTACIGAASAAWTYEKPFLPLYQTWWLSNAIGILLLTPLAVTWLHAHERPKPKGWPWALEVLAAGIVAAIISWSYFGWDRWTYDTRPHSYMLLIPLVWAGMRLGMRGATLLLLLLALAETGMTVLKIGLFPLGGSSPADRILAVQLFLAAKSTITLLLSASIAERQLALEALREGEARLRMLGDNLPDSMVYQVARGPHTGMQFQYISAGIERLNGLSADAVLKNPKLLYEQVVEEDRALIAKAEEESFRDRKTFNVVVRMRRTDGVIRWMHVCSKPRDLPDGRTVWDGIETDITDRMQAEVELRRVNRALLTISNCNQVLVHETNELALLEKLCRIITTDGGYLLAWVGYAEQDEYKSVRPAGCSGAEKGYLESLKLCWSDSERGRGPVGTAIRTGLPQICHDLANDPRTAFWHAEAERMGFKSILALPLKHADNVFGALSIYSASPNAFDKEEIKLLGELASDLAFGIQALRTQERRHQAEESVRKLLSEAGQARAALLNILEDQKLADEALRESESRLRTLVQGMPVLMDAFDEKGLIVAWNRECERVTGYTAAEMLGNPRAVELLYPDTEYRTRMFKVWNERGNSYRNWIWNLTCKDGTERSIEWSNVSAELPIPGWATWGIGVDVTERLKLEEKLRQSQKLHAIGQLAGGVAHDFNNLLTVINGYSEMLLTELPLDPAARKPVMGIRDAGERASMLTRQLLLFSRKAVIKPKVLDLNAKVEHTRQLLHRLIGEDINLATILAPNLPSIEADPGQLEQVIMNLSLNARDAMPNGGRLTLETSEATFDDDYCLNHPDYRPGRFVKLAVSDTGTGMIPEVKAHLFEPFFTTKGLGKGTGLGLATVYGIVQQCNGFITVYSEPNVGTTFNVFLPACTKVQATQPAAPKASGRIIKGNATVLIVEDEEIVREVAQQALEMHGYKVLVAATGAQALQLLAQHQESVALVITDVIMPEMSGRQFVEKLRASHSGFKVLYMSGYNDDAIVRHGVNGVADAFLQKPFTPTILAEKVREILSAKA